MAGTTSMAAILFAYGPGFFCGFNPKESFDPETDCFNERCGMAQSTKNPVHGLSLNLEAMISVMKADSPIPKKKTDQHHAY